MKLITHGRLKRRRQMGGLSRVFGGAHIKIGLPRCLGSNGSSRTIITITPLLSAGAALLVRKAAYAN